MAKLNASRRNKLKKSTFGLPGQRKYPMPDRGHAANAKARAAQQVKRGNLSPAQAASIDAKANKILGNGAGSASNAAAKKKGAKKAPFPPKKAVKKTKKPPKGK